MRQGALGIIRHHLVMGLLDMVQMQVMEQLLHGMLQVVVVLLLHQQANHLVGRLQGMVIKDMDMVDMVGMKAHMQTRVGMVLLGVVEAQGVLQVVQLVLAVINMGQDPGTWVEVMVMSVGAQVIQALGNLTHHKVEVTGLLRSLGLLDQATMEVFSPGKLSNSDTDPSFVRSFLYLLLEG